MKMLVIILTTLTILLVSLVKHGTYSPNVKDSIRNDKDNEMLSEILKRIDRMERNNDIRFDKLEDNVKDIEANIQNIVAFALRIDIAANDLHMRNNIKNLSVVMETIVEQQMVITAEIFTVSQTLSLCCCQYQNTTVMGTTTPRIETTTPKPVKSLPKNCAEAMGESDSDGIYQINVTDSNIGPFDVYCMKKDTMSFEEEISNGTWLIIQRRQDNTTDFYQNWNWYQRGFGELNGNFWIGLDKLYAITKSTKQELWIQLEDHDGNIRWAKYSHFGIGNEYEKYALKTLGSYVGTAGDSLRRQENQKWSTFDQDNDQHPDNCAERCKGAWWYKDCHDSNLNGIYGSTVNGNGINCYTWHGWEYSLKYVHMAIRLIQ